jgi:murein DD-endopeptidase MepM/ murein hydrolase activator NlpD
MKLLNDTQLQELTNYLNSSLQKYEPLQEELLDHLACIIEEKMATGMDYSTAKAQALVYFTKDEVKKTEGKTRYFVHTKPVIMKVFSFLGLILLAILAATPFNKEEEPLPLAMEEEPEKPFFVEFIPDQDPPDICPLYGQPQITSEYGQRIHPVFKKKVLHRGVDFKASLGTPVVATADGVIEFADEEKNYGLKVVIQHEGAYQSLYAHMSAIKVKAGEKVKKGTVIGLVGSSGASTAPHLHYEILKDGKAVNPAEYLPKS